jgi:CubicO group peptidase (beta-lactamase class C family)
MRPNPSDHIDASRHPKRALMQRLAPLLLSATATLFGGCESLNHAVDVSAYFTSHQLCSAVFVAGLDPHQFYEQGVAPLIGPAGPLISYEIDREHKTVTATTGSLAKSRAVYRGPLGCLVLHGEAPPVASLELDTTAPGLLPPIAGPGVVEPGNHALKSALDRAFSETHGPPHRWTKAIVIVHDGRIVAERYAPGYRVDTPLIGWSMTKSVINAMIGILVRKRNLVIDVPAPVARWSDPQDPRHRITIDNLLRMTSGLELGQSLTADWITGFDQSARMEFDMPDMAAFAEGARLVDMPGTKWNYSNGNTIILSRIIRDQVGGDAASVVRFAHRELFDKLGMEHVTLEFDGVGTPIGASHMWATARDWVRLGLLYLNDGVVGGERILPEGWVNYSARYTFGSDEYGYGAGFWTNRGTSSGALTRVHAGMPDDSFMARGILGQYVVVIPSAKIVIVRLGMAYTQDGDIATVERLVADTIAALN